MDNFPQVHLLSLGKEIIDDVLRGGERIRIQSLRWEWGRRVGSTPDIQIHHCQEPILWVSGIGSRSRFDKVLWTRVKDGEWRLKLWHKRIANRETWSQWIKRSLCCDIWDVCDGKIERGLPGSVQQCLGPGCVVTGQSDLEWDSGAKLFLDSCKTSSASNFNNTSKLNHGQRRYETSPSRHFARNCICSEINLTFISSIKLIVENRIVTEELTSHKLQKFTKFHI